MTSIQPPATDTASAWHALSAQDTCFCLNSNSCTGLAAEEVARRSRIYGPNRLEEKRLRTKWAICFEQFKNVMLVLLIVVAIASGILDAVEMRAGTFDGVPFKDTVAILTIVILNGLLGYLQESRAEKALAALRQLSAPKVRVLRDNKTAELDAAELVPGDIVWLEAGTQLAADARLLVAAHLQVRESALTGEATPVLKSATAVLDEDAALGDRINLVFAGTEVLQGRGQAIVINTGKHTELGRIAELLESVETAQTPLQRRMTQLGNALVVGSMLLVALTIGIGVLRTGWGRLLELIEVSLSMAVAVVPEGLPAAITVTLAIGTQRMVRRKALIRRLPAVETLGSVNTICSDKTGTLTQNKMVVQEVAIACGAFHVTGEGYAPSGKFVLGEEAIAPAQYPDLQALLVAGVLCNDATLQFSGAQDDRAPDTSGERGEWQVFGDPTEGALLVLGAKAGFANPTLDGRYQRLSEFPFDSERKRMSAICRATDADVPRSEQALVLFAKGSPESLLARCTVYQAGEDAIALDERERDRILAANADMADRGLRVLGFAYKPLDVEPADADAAETDLVWLGLAGMMDAARPEARPAVDRCIAAGIRPVMITGDHPLTAHAIAQQLGIARPGDQVLTGPELAKMSDGDLKAAVDRTSVYARVSPEHKLRIVEALQQRGCFVAMTGDGVNDAPALKRADIGIAMGITGTDVSKEASDMVLLDDNFATIVAATEEGRVVYDNIRRFIKYILGSNVGEVLTIAAAPLIGLGDVPLVPLQILWMNLVTDGLPALALAVEPANPDIMKRSPFDPGESIFARGLGWYIIRVGIVFALFTIVLMSWSYGQAQGSANPESWKTMVFTTLCIAQMGHAIAVRSDKPAFEMNPFSNPYLLAAVSITTVLQLMLVYVPPLQAFFGTHRLSLVQLGICLGFSTLVFVWVELEKLFLRWWRSRRRLRA
ncbi:ATPase, P-type (transporting), HAD superfamily, subfamily IC [Rubidibacter lacunae KORDI 51-2]|uniref:ATPase, P-type (Transporting), HAD superfamily, subfamily IC n=1 Tax=Rubidibacter lacunae KORDI 51-2 TaxID=582515 RepID=U5DHS2_9CHRO|nr:cation-transporting P-type ATPase [Rubidibacter lacunae]ERN40154.1 ATPase, P-type (transporting), HAD superfamily, subfamily IC [Rubidibacter lacunae KORDI 51-2]